MTQRKEATIVNEEKRELGKEELGKTIGEFIKFLQNEKIVRIGETKGQVLEENLHNKTIEDIIKMLIKLELPQLVPIIKHNEDFIKYCCILRSNQEIVANFCTFVQERLQEISGKADKQIIEELNSKITKIEMEHAQIQLRINPFQFQLQEQFCKYYLKERYTEYKTDQFKLINPSRTYQKMILSFINLVDTLTPSLELMKIKRKLGMKYHSHILYENNTSGINFFNSKTVNDFQELEIILETLFKIII